MSFSSSHSSLLILVLAATGCAYRTPKVDVPPTIPEGPLEVAEVSVVDLATPVSPETTAEITRDAERILARANRTHPAGDATRVRVKVELGEEYSWVNSALSRDGMAILGMTPILFGMTTGSQAVKVDVSFESNGRTLNGHGEAKKDGGLYVPARRRALAAALDRALADA